MDIPPRPWTVSAVLPQNIYPKPTEATPRRSSQKRFVPTKQELIPGQVTSEEVIPGEVVPEEVVPEEIVPEEAVLEDIVLLW